MVPIGGTYTMDWEEAAGFVKAMQPRMAIPMHYGFVVCSPSHAGRFRKGAQPCRSRSWSPRTPSSNPEPRNGRGTKGSDEMALGYDRPLYILAFDHRGSFQKEVLRRHGGAERGGDGPDLRRQSA
jgi:hypothetical protein